MLPTPPAAPLMNTVSPGLTSAAVRKAPQAVAPCDRCAAAVGSASEPRLRTRDSSTTANSRHPQG